MEYRVLARKYRPVNFDDLIGQDVLVRTLSNAIKSNRIAHAFLLTGIRGIGKTTTARIIARALNCVGADGKGGATINPCGVCSNCKMIGEDRHVDVLEMDAASHTGVDAIRDLIDTVRYLPSSARYKIYIIDEVHMLTNNAFNALLKTLEEPPSHVKFIFATTESRKIPVTILSRCQRFDLKRIDSEMLATHLANICAKEQVQAEEEALKLIAIAAEGSVRDALSILDQAIARGVEEKGELKVEAAAVRQMIGAADHSATFRLLEILLSGDVAQAIADVEAQYKAGSDPLMLVQDALSIVHLVTRVKVAPVAAMDVSLSEHDRIAAKKLADGLSMPILTRLWQMLLKGISEVKLAPSPLSALEMLLVRIAYSSQLPTPVKIIKNLDTQKKTPELVFQAVDSNVQESDQVAENFEQAVELFNKNRELLLYTQLKNDVWLVAFEVGKIDLKISTDLSRDFITKVTDCLNRWTKMQWKIILSNFSSNPSLHEQESTRKEKDIKKLSAHPLVASALQQFPGATVVGVK
jgi:DNA polymerase-3 subunit gamma/tau